MNDEEKKEERVRWRKIGGGSHVLRRRDGQKKRIKKNEIFKAYPDEIPEAFRDVIVPVNEEELRKSKEPFLQSSSQFEVKKRKIDELTEDQKEALAELNVEPGEGEAEEEEGEGSPIEQTLADENTEVEYKIKDRSQGWYDVVNSVTGKSMNEMALRIGEAEELVSRLNS